MPSVNRDAARLDLIHVDNDDLSVSFTVTENSIAYVTTGATIATQILASDGTDTGVTFTDSWNSNTLTLTLSDAVALSAGSYRWALTVTKSGITRTWVAGELKRVSAQRAGALSTTSTATTLEINGTSTISLAITSGSGIGGIRIEDEGTSTVASAVAINFEGAGVTVTDAGSNEATVTISGGGGGGTTITVQEGDSTVSSAIDTLDFGAGFDVTASPSNEANIALDLTEYSGGALPVAGGGTGATSAGAARTALDVDQAGTAATLVAAHEADTTSVHGIADTSVLLTTTAHDSRDHTTAMSTVVLDDISDVTITAAATGDIIRWNGSAWVDYPDSNYQPVDSDLTAIAALSTTAYGRAFLALADQAATMALLSAASTSASGIVELATTAETQTGTDTVRAITPAGGAATYQPLDSDLTSIAALTTTSYGRALLTLADAASADWVTKALFDANTILAANADNTPAAVTVGTQRIVGRITAGNITALTGDEVCGVLSGADTGGMTLQDVGAVEYRVNTVATTGATETLDTSVYGVHDCTMDQNCVFTFSNPAPSGEFSVFVLILRGAFTPTFPASVDWPDATPPTYSTPTVYTFTTVDAGTTWLGASRGKAFA